MPLSWRVALPFAFNRVGMSGRHRSIDEEFHFSIDSMGLVYAGVPFFVYTLLDDPGGLADDRAGPRKGPGNDGIALVGGLVSSPVFRVGDSFRRLAAVPPSL